MNWMDYEIRRIWIWTEQKPNNLFGCCGMSCNKTLFYYFFCIMYINERRRIYSEKMRYFLFLIFWSSSSPMRCWDLEDGLMWVLWNWNHNGRALYLGGFVKVLNFWGFKSLMVHACKNKWCIKFVASIMVSLVIVTN